VKLIKFTSIAIALLTAYFAEANDDGGLFVEPAVTYEMGSGDINFPTPLGSTDGDVFGFGLGARLGFHLNEAFFLGLDARYSMPKSEFGDWKENAKAYNWGPVIGMQMPDYGLRIWGSYIAGAELDPDGSSFDAKFKDGMGFRVGAGLRFQVVSVNIEYQEIKYDTAQIQAAGPFGPADFGSVELENKTWLASVSFPIQL
jgi:hypothetical protein